MKIPKTHLEMKSPCRRDLLISAVTSVFVTGAIMGILALVTLKVTQIFKFAEPIKVKQVESEEVEEPNEEIFEPSPAIPPAPAVLTPVAKLPLVAPDAVPVPEIDKVPEMDELAWAEEEFEPWEVEKKPEVKKKPTPRPVVAKKTTPRKKPTARPSKPTAKPVSARIVSRSSPSYPSRARRAGLEGRVIVTVTISTSGKVSSARVSTSSSHSSLDSAALRAAKRYRFAPAKNSRGQATTSQVSIPFNFKLT